MTKLLLSLISALLLPVMSIGQWTKQIGINVVPIIAKSWEFSSESNKHPGYSLTFNTGATFGAEHNGMVDHKVFDGVSSRRTSGFFLKPGARLYLASLKGRERRSNFYVGGSVIFSQYRQTAMQRVLQEDGHSSQNKVSILSKGVAICLAFSLGFTRRITDRFSLDWGFQKGFVLRKDDYLGTSKRNYQPGVGSNQSDPFVGYIQGNLSAKFRIP
jgi:hypothetical protein